MKQGTIEKYGTRNWEKMKQGTKRIWNKELGEYRTRNWENMKQGTEE